MLTPEEEECWIQQQMMLTGCSRMKIEQFLQRAKEEEERNRRERENLEFERSYARCFAKAFAEAEGPHSKERRVEAAEVLAMLAIADRLDELCRILRSRDDKEGD